MHPSTETFPDSIDEYPEDFWPDVDDLVTEDDIPLDNIFSEKQQRLLTEPLYSSQLDRPFAAMANVGLFYRTHHPPLVPDMLLSLGVKIPADVWSKSHRAYFVWEFGKPPDIVIEVVSNREGHELDTKILDYAAIGVKFYAVFDPEQLLGERLLRLHELHGTHYVERAGLWMPDLDLGLCLWDGAYEGMSARWLRWCDAQGNPIATGAESAGREQQRADQEQQRADQEQQRADQEQQRADQEQQRADQEQQRADQEQQRADQEQERAERMAEKLRALGIDPHQLSDSRQ
jgi:Uma2 family endonuclease